MVYLHIPSYLFLLREDDDDVIDIGKHDIRSVLPQPMLPTANPLFQCKPEWVLGTSLIVIFLKGGFAYEDGSTNFRCLYNSGLSFMALNA